MLKLFKIKQLGKFKMIILAFFHHFCLLSSSYLKLMD